MHGAFALLFIGYSRFTRNYCTHRPDTMLPGKEKGNDPAVAWHGLQRTLNHPNSGSHRLLAPASVTGLEVLVMRIPYRSGFRPTGPQWCYNSCSRRRITIVQKTRLGWTRRRLLRTFASKGKKEARANRRMQFKVGNYRDGSWESNIRMLTGTIKVDWIQLWVEPYLAALPTLQQGVIAGVFRQKGAAPWGITRVQLSVLLPNDLSLEDWYAGVYGLPTVWPEASMLGAESTQSCWLWFSSPEEEVWCQNHVGGSWPTMATLTESARDERTWLVLTCRAQGTTLHK